MDAQDPRRAAYVDYLARCDQAFHPYAPIELPEFFAGRIKHVQRLVSEITAPGRQVAIYGERGVGKTSLAQLAYFFVKRDEEHTHFVRCESSSTFDSIFADVLASAGVDVVLNGVESEGERHATTGLATVSVGASRRVRKTFRRISAGRQITPRLLLEQFHKHEGLIIVDEYDRVKDSATHTRMAELLKHFSDARSSSKIVLVGVAETLSQLIGEHESLSRSLAQIKLDRMSYDELEDIIGRGEERLDARFHDFVKHRIVRLADGFPYFVHLICRNAARAGGRQLLQNEHASVVIADDEYVDGLREAIHNAEYSLREQYASAVVTTRRPSEKFTLVLWGMALSDAYDVQVQDIVRNLAVIGEKQYTPASFSWTLGELSSDRRGHTLVRVREGFYKFANPLMRPYVRSLMELENILIRGRQWEFPFMGDGW